MARTATWVSIPLFLMGCALAGCGAKDNGSFHRAGERVGETITEFAKGVGSGVDNRLEVPVELSLAVSQLGLRTTVAKTSGLDKDRNKTITIYFIAGQPIKAWLMARAMNGEGEEVGRSTVEVQLSAEDATYVTFPFHPEMDTQRVAKYAVDIGKPVPPKPKKSAKEPPARGSEREV